MLSVVFAGTRLAIRATLFLCIVALLPKVDVMGDVVNFFVLLREGSVYLYLVLAVMCTSAWGWTDIAFWR